MIFFIHPGCCMSLQTLSQLIQNQLKESYPIYWVATSCSRPTMHSCPTITFWASDILSWTCLDLLTSSAGCVCLAQWHERCNSTAQRVLRRTTVVFLRCFRVSVRLLGSSKPNPLRSSCFHPCRGREGWLRGKVGGEIQTHTGPSRHIFHAKKPFR